MTRMVVTITSDMHQALKRQARKRGATLSGLTRVILADWLEQHGERVEWVIEWGGQPEKDKDGNT